MEYNSSEVVAVINAQNEMLVKSFLTACSETPEERAERERRDAEEWERVNRYFEHRFSYDGDEKVFHHC